MKKDIDLIKEFEGCYLHAYLDPVGIWTIGYGHTMDVKEGQTITQHQADVILDSDLEFFRKHVKNLCPSTTPNQSAALVSFAFNVGHKALRDSKLRLFHNLEQFTKASDEFLRWVYAKRIKLPGLERRRKAERAVYLGLDDAKP